jgi:DNA-binding protein H-NS
MNNELLEQIKRLNEDERNKHEQKKQAAIQRIKELRRTIRTQQKTMACENTPG